MLATDASMPAVRTMDFAVQPLDRTQVVQVRPSTVSLRAVT